jgi:putative metallohydrolase (TIGR04338 family)
MRKRDTQRSRVYTWERRAHPPIHSQDERFQSVEDCAAYMLPIWRSERGRYGLPNKAPPEIARPHRGQRRALAHSSHKITLPRWARNEWVMLHELAHRLTPRDAGHGPRFVGVLIGLLARHAGQDADELMALADEMGVKYHVRSIGAVPVTSLPEKLAKLLPIGYMDAAFALDVSYRQVYGAALSLIRHGRARWRGKTLVPA